ncbi:MAG: RNA-guided endonuclease InsQ/TnpB family protein [Rubrobacteraceae bacterium]
MKLTVQVKLLPSKEQADALKETLRRSNAAANEISAVAWEHSSFGQYKLHKLAYHAVRASTGLTSRMVIRAIAKVADAYKLDRRRKRAFKALGAIAYDDRILRWRDEEVSIWTAEGRQAIPFVCGERTAELLEFRQGESDLAHRGGKWFLLATVNVEEPPPGTPEDWVGVDFGVANIATDSDGEARASERTENSRERYERIRSKLQAAGTSNAKRHLKNLAGRERRMKRDANHVISRRLVSKAADSDRGICLEDLQGIRKRTTVRKARRSRHGKWAFGELRAFVEYKARLAGVAFAVVDPRHTSRTCNECGHCEKANRRSRREFVCKACGFVASADENAAVNIRSGASVMMPIAAGAGPQAASCLL